MANEINDQTRIRVLLQMAGVNPTQREIDELAAGFESTRAMVASLHSMSGIRYEEPAVMFDARPQEIQQP